MWREVEGEEDTFYFYPVREEIPPLENIEFFKDPRTTNADTYAHDIFCVVQVFKEKGKFVC